MLRSRHIGPGDGRESLHTAGAEPPWTRNDALVTGGACAMNLLSYALFHDPAGQHDVSVAGFLLVALAAMPLLARRSHPVAAFAAVLVLDVTAAVTVPLPSHFGAVLVVSLYSVARARPGRVTAVAAVATVFLMLLSQSIGRMPTWQEAMGPPLSTLIVVGGAMAVNRWQREVAANRRLLADRAVADERRRIARELHDIVAHHITTMQLMAGGARANITRPEVVRDALVTLEAPGGSRCARCASSSTCCGPATNRRPRRRCPSPAPTTSTAWWPSPALPDCRPSSASAGRGVRCRRPSASRYSGSPRRPSPTPANTRGPPTPPYN
ncbi:histidine kinase dimerization/phosphoacceptor domain-containing protein [Streptomyces sp. ISL-43]|uniref:histidine kinase n=1 Tax=Streptomyces sp. ISL-43 TaxID=2819183 RepID=UPI001BE56EE8|nr:histidine kinase dimerization/phosphoacceptor domain-containing protein [Streptomyces sp. ISL-43]MBT2449754.1 histidine kinase dimerization/phosphoacceptor domain-containing protein [Streptomyces sp. ISL-43]